MLSNTTIRRSTAGIPALTFIAALTGLGLTWAQEAEKESFRAHAIVMGIHASGTTTTFQITVSRWSSEEEREELFAALMENDQDVLIRALQKQEECGFIRITGSRGLNTTNPRAQRAAAATRRSSFPSQRIRYAREFRKEGQRRIVLALDRPIPYWEAVSMPRTIDYGLTIVVLDLDEEDKGEGRMAIGVKLKLDMDNKQLEIENFSSEPVRLTNVRKTS